MNNGERPRVCRSLNTATAHLEDVVGTLAAQVVLAGQDHHRLGEHLQADGTDELLLQALHDAEEQRGADRNTEDGRASGARSPFRRTHVSRYRADMPLYVKGHGRLSMAGEGGRGQQRVY